MPPLAIGAAVGGVGSLLGGIFGASSSQKAAQEQIAADQQAQGALQNNENQGMSNLQPYMAAGNQATGTLSQMLSQPGQGLLTPWTQQFTAPTAAQAAATPGYQFQLQQGENALQNSAAAQGGLLSGGTLAGMNNYAQGVASTNYQNTFNNAQSQYNSAYQTFLNNQQNQYNMLAGQSSQGLQAANSGNQLITGIGGDIASLYGAEGQARAAGTIGTANAVSGAIGGVSNAAMMGSLGQMMNPASAFGTPAVQSGDMTGNGNALAGVTPPYMPAAPGSAQG
jgi:hypothetical protein